MRRWMAFACGAAVLCAAAWYFGRPTVKPDAPTPVVAQAAPTEAPKEPPPKLIEVIDLARAYEPVREPEPVLPGGVDPASFIEEPSAPRRIPPAFDEDNAYADVVRTEQERDGSICEQMELMPRVVPPSHDPGFWGIGSGPVQNLLHYSGDPPHVRLGTPSPEAIALWLQVPELYGYVGGTTPGVSSVKTPERSVEQLSVMPRIVPTLVIQAEEPLRYERLNGNIGP